MTDYEDEAIINLEELLSGHPKPGTPEYREWLLRELEKDNASNEE